VWLHHHPIVADLEVTHYLAMEAVQKLALLTLNAPRPLDPIVLAENVTIAHPTMIVRGLQALGCSIVNQLLRNVWNVRWIHIV